jgi:hypothetical protein
MNDVTRKEIEEIRYLREVEKLKIKEISKLLGKKSKRISYIIQKYTKYKFGKKFEDQEKEKIIKMFESGYTKEQIANTTGRTFYSVSNFLTRHYGITNSYRLVRKNNFKIWSKDEENYILKNYEHKTAIQIAKDLNRTVLGVRTRIIKMRRENKKIVKKKIGGYNKDFANSMYVRV